MGTKIIKYLNIGLGSMLGISVMLILNLLTNMDDPTKLASSLNGNFYWCYFLLGIGAAAILIYSLVQTLILFLPARLLHLKCKVCHPD